MDLKPEVAVTQAWAVRRSILALMLFCGLAIPQTLFASDSPTQLVLKSKTLKIAVDYDTTFGNPLFYRDNRGNNFGIEWHLAQEVAKQITEGCKVKVVVSRWERIPELVRNKTVQLGIQSFFIPKDSEVHPKERYSLPYLKSGLSILVKKESPIKNMDDLKKKQAGAYADPTALGILAAWGVSTPKVFDQERDLFESLKTGAVDYIAYDMPIARTFAKKESNTVRELPQLFPGSEIMYGVLMPSGDEDLYAKVNAAIQTWKMRPDVQKIASEFRLEIP